MNLTPVISEGECLSVYIQSQLSLTSQDASRITISDALIPISINKVEGWLSKIYLFIVQIFFEFKVYFE